MKGKAFLTYTKSHNSVVSERYKPTCNPIPILPETNVHAKLEKIGQKVLKIEHGNKALTDGQTDGNSKFGGYNIIPRHFLCDGYKNYENI